MDDGKIVFSTALDNKGLEKDLANLKKKIRSQEDEISSYQQMKNPLVEQSAQLSAQLDAAKAKLYQMQQAAAGVFSKEQIAEQKENVAMIQNQWNGVQRKVESYEAKIQSTTIKMEQNKQKAGEIAEQLAKTGPAARKMAEAMAASEKSAQRFKLRLKEVLRSALVFTLLTQGAAKFREWIGKVIRTNDEATAAVARLKGALLTLAQPIVEVIIPALTVFLNLLTAIIGEIAKVVSALFGMTIDQSAEAAEGLQEEVDGLEDTGAAAKKAGKSLASFDEINKLSDNSTSASKKDDSQKIAPDFSWMDGISERLQDIAKYVLLIAAGLALWKIASSIPGVLGTILTFLAGLLILIGGVALAYEGFTDAWENGVDWGNLAMMIAGVAAAALGLYLMFGPIAAGIGLVVGGVLMLVTAFRDMFENGITVQNVLLAIAGILATGLGISLITGSWIPMLIAGVAAVLMAIVMLTGNGEQLLGNLKDVFNGFLKFVTGIFTGDLEMAVEGTEQMLKGLVNTALTIVGSLVNFIIMGLNWLIEKINSISFDVPDWVPEIGGKKLSPNIPAIKEWTIPQLATGAVIPPNREFLAVLGDQKNGTNIETPLSTMVDAFKQAMMETGGGGRSGGDVVLQIDGRTFARLTNPYMKSENGRVGTRLVNGTL